MEFRLHLLTLLLIQMPAVLLSFRMVIHHLKSMCLVCIKCRSYTGSIIRAAKVKPSVFKDDTKTEKKKAIYKPCEREPITPKQVEEHEKVVVNKGESIEVHKETKTLEKKPQIITVELSAVYQAIIERLEKDSRPLLGFLRERKIISNENQFFNLKPDITRFLIRQEEKKHENSTANANGM